MNPTSDDEDDTWRYFVVDETRRWASWRTPDRPVELCERYQAAEAVLDAIEAEHGRLGVRA